MSDLNIMHAQNADLKSRVSDSGLSCDSPTSAPDRKDIEAFRLAMQEGGQRFYDFPNSTPSADDKLFEPNMRNEDGNVFSEIFERQDKTEADPQAALSSIFSMVSTFSNVDAPARVEAPHAILSEDDLNMLVERILVSAAKDGTQEVRLILNESVLSGTEIVLNRSLTGQLVVALHCSDASTFQTLVASQFDLKHLLEEREASTVQVSVNIQQENGDAERRSRGYYDYDPTQPWNRDNA